MPTDNDRVSTLVFLGTDTIYSPTSDEARDKAGQLPQGNDYGETLSILSVLLSNGPLEVNKSVEPISQPQIHLIEGPNTLGTEVGDRIARGIFRILDSVLSNDTNIFNILAHSRGAVEAILLAHEIQRIQRLFKPEIENPHYSGITASPDQANQSWWAWLGLTRDYTTYGQMNNGPLAKDFELLINSLKTIPASAERFRTNIVKVRFNMYLLDPVPGGRLLPNTEWHDPRFMLIPDNVCEFNQVIYKNERSRGFKCIIPVAVEPSITKTQYIPLEGHHGTASGNHLDQRRQIASPIKDKLVQVTPLIQQLIIKQMILFLRRNGVNQFRAQQEMMDFNIHPRILETIYDANTQQVFDDKKLNESIFNLYTRIYKNKDVFKCLELHSYFGTGVEGSRHLLVNPVIDRLVHGNKQYIERGLLPLQDIIPPVDGFINQDHQVRAINAAVYNEFQIQSDDMPAERLKKIVQFMIKKLTNLSAQTSPSPSPSVDARQQPTRGMYVDCAKMHLSNLVDDYLNGKYSLEDRQILISEIKVQLVCFRDASLRQTDADFLFKVQDVFETTLAHALQKKQQRVQVSLQGLKVRLEESPQVLQNQLRIEIEALYEEFKLNVPLPEEINSQQEPLKLEVSELQETLNTELDGLVKKVSDNSSDTLCMIDDLKKVNTILESMIKIFQSFEPTKLLAILNDDLPYVNTLKTVGDLKELLREFLEAIDWLKDPKAIQQDIESLEMELSQLSTAQNALAKYIGDENSRQEILQLQKSLERNLDQIKELRKSLFPQGEQIEGPLNHSTTASYAAASEAQSTNFSELSHELQSQSSLDRLVQYQDDNDANSSSLGTGIETHAPSNDLSAQFINSSEPVLYEAEEQQSDSEFKSSYGLDDLFSLDPSAQDQDNKDTTSISVDPEIVTSSPSTELTNQGDDSAASETYQAPLLDKSNFVSSEAVDCASSISDESEELDSASHSESSNRWLETSYDCVQNLFSSKSSLDPVVQDKEVTSEIASLHSEMANVSESSEESARRDDAVTYLEDFKESASTVLTQEHLSTPDLSVTQASPNDSRESNQDYLKEALVGRDSHCTDVMQEQHSDRNSESSYGLDDLFSLDPSAQDQDTEDTTSPSMEPVMKNPSQLSDVTDQGVDAVKHSDGSDSESIASTHGLEQATGNVADASFNNPQNRSPSLSEPTERIFQELIDNQLYPLTIQYRDHLQKIKAAGSDRNTPSESTLNKKLQVLNELVNILSPKEQNILSNEPRSSKKRVENFYSVLKIHDNQEALKKHRDPQWGRFVRNAFAVVAILATGILPGMLVLACLFREKTRSMAFWKPRGAGFFDTAQKYRPEGSIDIADDQRGNRPDDASPAAQF